MFPEVPDIPVKLLVLVLPQPSAPPGEIVMLVVPPVAFVELQIYVILFPATTEEGLILSEAVGTTGAAVTL